MVNALYDSGREGFLAGNIDWDGDVIRLVFVDHADDTPSVTLDDNLDDILAVARVAISPVFAGKTTTDGVADANDVTVPGVTGDIFESITIYQDTGNEATSILIVYIDTATNLPFTPNGGDVVVQWNNGANRIFRL